MLKKSAKSLVAEANAAVECLPPELAVKLVGDPSVLFVDVREASEVADAGRVEGAINVPRGVLEFQVDPESPTHRAEFDRGRRLVLYCGSGARSALAAQSLKQMGLDNIAHVPAGFAALRQAGARIVA